MNMKMINYNLPEFCFLDGNSHEGNALQDRTVIQHVRSYSVFDVIDLSKIAEHEIKAETYHFTYVNTLGEKERHMLVLHFSLSFEPGSQELNALFEKTADWYCKYLEWEDRNILDYYGSTNN